MTMTAHREPIGLHETGVFVMSNIEKDCDVKRDMELIRSILLAIQSKSNLNYEPIPSTGVDELLFGRHMEMLYNEGLIEAIDGSSVDNPVPNILVKDLSWSGHDFAGSIEKDEWWQKIKEQIGPSALASLSIKTIKDLSLAWVTSHIKGIIGL
jgi:hypothetical protein